MEINPADAGRLGIQKGEKITVASRRGAITLNTDICERVKPGVLFIPFHYSEAAANKLTIAAIDPVANIPEFKACAARLEKLT